MRLLSFIILLKKGLGLNAAENKLVVLEFRLQGTFEERSIGFFGVLLF